MKSLSVIVREVINSAGGIKYVAGEIDISNPHILANQLCPTNRQHKLGAEDLRKIINVCKPYSTRILHTLANDLDSIVVQLPKLEDSEHELMQLILRAGKEFGDVSKVLSKSIDLNSDGGVDITADELDQIEKEVNDANRVFQEILALARKMSSKHPQPSKTKDVSHA